MKTIRIAKSGVLAAALFFSGAGVASLWLLRSSYAPALHGEITDTKECVQNTPDVRTGHNTPASRLPIESGKPTPPDTSLDTSTAAILTAGLDLRPDTLARVTLLLRECRHGVLAELASNSTVAEHSAHSVSIRTSLPIEKSQALRASLYAKLADAIGEEQLAKLTASDQANLLDGECEGFGERPSVFTTTIDRKEGECILIAFRTDSQRVIGGEVANTYSGGTLGVEGFVDRYGQLAELALRKLRGSDQASVRGEGVTQQRPRSRELD